MSPSTSEDETSETPTVPAWMVLPDQPRGASGLSHTEWGEVLAEEHREPMQSGGGRVARLVGAGGEQLIGAVGRGRGRGRLVLGEVAEAALVHARWDRRSGRFDRRGHDASMEMKVQSPMRGALRGGEHLGDSMA